MKAKTNKREMYYEPKVELIYISRNLHLLREFSVDGEFEGINLDEESYGAN